MKQSLQLKLSQSLTLTPQLQQAIKLLQLSTLEMNQEIERYLLENPLLEREDGEGGEGADYGPGATGVAGNGDTVTPDRAESSEESRDHESGEPSEFENEGMTFSDDGDDRWAGESGSYGSPHRDDEDDEMQDTRVAATSLRDHLFSQLGLTQLSMRDRGLVGFLIESLDDDGYLSISLDELYENLPDELDIEPEELGIALKHLQHFDPTGVGARSPQECLALQLRAQPEGPVRNLALRVVEECLNLLAARDFPRILKQTGCSESELKVAQDLILGLDPRPGARHTPAETHYITPDVLVRKVRGRWVSQINPDAYPRLRINRLYADILSRQRRGEGGLTGQLQEARWLIKNVQQRFETIQRVSQAVVDRQRQFFEHGEVAMRPLVLREIADLLDLHESTISRVTSQKYMATPRGIFELKYFFGSHVSTDTGGACSATAIRALIKQLIAGEDGRKPLSDSQISEILGRQGIVVARRTVAKYRESLNIPPVNLRKTL